MPNRKISKRDKKLPMINLYLKLKVPFSISAHESLKEKFQTYCSDNNTDMSKKVRDFMYKDMNIKNEEELRKLLSPSIKQATKIILDKMKVEERKFSERVNSHIEKFMKRGK